MADDAMVGRAPHLIEEPGRTAALQIIVALAAIAMYLPAIGFDLVFDDRSLIASDGPNPLGSQWLPYRPLRYLSLWLDHGVARAIGPVLGPRLGWDVARCGAAVYHASNILLHALVGTLVVRLARRLGAAAWAALAAGLLFVVHPLAVEAVAYVAGRRDLLATALGVASVLAWTSPRGRSAVALVLLVLGVAAKESALLFMPVLVAASWFGLGPRLALAWKPLTWVSLAALALPVAYGATGPLAPSGPLATKAVIAGRLAWHYAAGLWWPSALAVEYPHLRCAETCGALWGVEAAAGLILLASFVAFASVSAWRRLGAGASGAEAVPAGQTCQAATLGFAITWVTLLLLPLAVVIGMHEPGADRHAYPLLVALAVLVALLVDRLGGAARDRPGLAARAAVLTLRIFVGVFFVVFVSMSTATRARMRVWQSERSLWEATVATAPASSRARHNLAGVLARGGAHAKARRELRRVLAADRDYAPALLGLAAVACAERRPVKAARHLAKARERGLPESDVNAVERACATAYGGS